MALNIGFGEMSLVVLVVVFWKTISDYEQLGAPLHSMEAKLKSKPIPLRHREWILSDHFWKYSKGQPVQLVSEPD